MKKLVGLISLSLLSACTLHDQNVNADAEDNKISQQIEKDSFAWLEDVEGENAMTWVNNQNRLSENELTQSAFFEPIKNELLDIYNSKEKIRYVRILGDKVYNFWRDEEHPRGLYREALLVDYVANKPKWETVLDIGKLNQEENENWVYKGMSCLFPDYEKCLVNLSRGGADAKVTREFHMPTRTFVQDGFYLSEAKSQVSWKDENTLYVGTDFGKGSLTDSGYPRLSKLWQRGTDLTDATPVFEGKKASVSVGAYRYFSIHGNFDFAYESTSFYTNKWYIIDNDKQIEIVKPDDASLSGIYKNQVFITLKSDWDYQGNAFKQGAVISASKDSLLQQKPNYKVFVEPSDEKVVEDISFSKSYIWVNWMNDVNSEVERFTMDDKGNWSAAKLPFDGKGTLSLIGMQESSDAFFVNYSSFLQPSTLYYMDGAALNNTELQKLPDWFDAEKYKVEQHFATSKDGTKVPYFLVMAKDAKLDGKNPTLLYGYGGFEISLQPYYSATVGKVWLERGGVYALANIRGGGEYGPRWHQAALKQNRNKSYEDFEAIAQDLIAKKVTSPRHLGAQGGSNGGLLMGNMITRSPELFNAIVCQVPLLDMKRYNKLLAGASWMAEYGNPDIDAEWKFIKTFSPYHNLDADKSYPKVFFTTSTRDDRVHPGHARKMVAKMLSMNKNVLYYENIEGGHAGAADNVQRAHLSAMAYTYLFEQLK